MATQTLEAAAEGQSTGWSLFAGASKVVAVNSPDDDDTTRINAASAVQQSFYLTSLPAASSINSVLHRMRTRDNTGDANKVVHQHRMLIGGNTTVGTSRNTGNTYSTFTDAGIARPGGGSWVPGDFDGTQAAGESAEVTIYASSFDTPSNIFCTTLNCDVDFVPGGGSMFIWMEWLPPILTISNLFGQCLNAESNLFPWLSEYLRRLGHNPRVSATSQGNEEEHEWVLNRLIYRPSYCLV